MTRLREQDICDISQMLKSYDNQLLSKTSGCLRDIAIRASGRDNTEAINCAVKTAVIPLTSGEGIIRGFSETVCGILCYLGADAFVTQKTDVAGLSQAVDMGAEIIFMADDITCSAMNIKSGKTADNGEFTGKGYAAALDFMSGGVSGKNALIIGAGPVGCGAAQFLVTKGAFVRVFDINTQKSEQLKSGKPAIAIEKNLPDAFKNNVELVVEATPSKSVIEASFLKGTEYIAAPGIPIGLSEEAVKKMNGGIIHDALEIGVASMFFAVINSKIR